MFLLKRFIRNFFCSIIILTLTNSCSSDSLDSELVGKWHLVYTHLGHPGSKDFSRGEIIYTFKFYGKVDVVINIDVHPYDVPSHGAGSFYYRIENDKLIISSVDTRYDYYFEDSNLIIDGNHAADGPLYRFEKD